MPGSPRRDLVRDGEIATYHVWSRTVQQKYLMGIDFESNRNHEHRREWFVRLLAYLAKVFAVDVANFHPMDNHFHLIVRTRPDVVSKWSDEEVAWRWRMAWPKFHEEREEWYRNPTDSDIRKLLGSPDKLLSVRGNLSSLSWFMARLKEPFAKLCNAEVGAQGHFWAERFGSRELVDDAAILACSMYVDVNQVKSQAAPSLLTSMYSAIQARMIEGRLREAEEAIEDFHKREGETLGISLAQLQEIYLSCSWIAPVQPDGDLKLVNDAWHAFVSPGQPATELPRMEIPDNDASSAEITQNASSSLAGDAIDSPTDRVEHDPGTIGRHKETEPEEDPSNVTPHDCDTDIVSNTPDEPHVTVEVSPSVATVDSHGTDPPFSDSGPSAKVSRSHPTFEIHRRLFSHLPPRTSDSPFLAMTLEQYLQLAEAAEKRALTSMEEPLSESLLAALNARGITSEAWYKTLDSYHELFFHFSVRPEASQRFAIPPTTSQQSDSLTDVKLNSGDAVAGRGPLVGSQRPAQQLESS